MPRPSVSVVEGRRASSGHGSAAPGAGALGPPLADADSLTGASGPPGARRGSGPAPEAGPGDKIVLYEIYDDAAAFDAHLATPHFAVFNEVTTPLVARKTVHRLGFAATP